MAGIIVDAKQLQRALEPQRATVHNGRLLQPMFSHGFYAYYAPGMATTFFRFCYPFTCVLCADGRASGQPTVCVQLHQTSPEDEQGKAPIQDEIG